MGNWGGNNEDGENEWLEDQIRQQRADMESQRRELSQRRLDLLKSEGEGSWQPMGLPPRPRTGIFEQIEDKMQNRFGTQKSKSPSSVASNILGGKK